MEEDIRKVIDQENLELRETQDSVTQKILGIGGRNREEAVLNAQEEAKRLLEGGEYRKDDK